MKKNKKIIVVIKKADAKFLGFSKDHQISACGKSIPELINNIYEKVLYANDDKINTENLRFEIDLKQFFKYYKIINARLLAEKIGMNPSLLSQYVHGHKNPSTRQAEKILTGIQQVGKELSRIDHFQLS